MLSFVLHHRGARCIRRPCGSSLDCLAGAACSRFFHRYDDRPRFWKNAVPEAAFVSAPHYVHGTQLLVKTKALEHQTPGASTFTKSLSWVSERVTYRQMRSGAPLVMNRRLSASSMPVRTVWLASRSAATSGEKDHGRHAPRQHGGRPQPRRSDLSHRRPAISNRNATLERQEPPPSAIRAGRFGSTQED